MGADAAVGVLVGPSVSVLTGASDGEGVVAGAMGVVVAGVSVGTSDGVAVGAGVAVGVTSSGGGISGANKNQKPILEGSGAGEVGA